MGCCCRSKSSGGGCCCGRRGATVAFGLLGLLLASAVITPPVYIYKTDQDFTKMFPIFKFGRQYLAQIAGGDPNLTGGITETSTSAATAVSTQAKEGPDSMDDNAKHAQTYKLAIFQLLDDIEEKSRELAFFSFCMGCLNVPLHLMLLIGATFKKSYFLLPWLVIALVEHLVIGVPLIVFFGLISLYLASQLQLCIWASLLIGSVVFAFLVSLSSWLTVYRCYAMFRKGGNFESSSGYGNSTDGQLTQPLLSGPTPPPLPPNHPSTSGYNLGQNPQYYPPHGNQRSLPSAPPPGGIYPSLA